MSLLVDDLLLLARLDEGRPLEHEPVDLDEVVGEAVETARTVEPDAADRARRSSPRVVLGDRDRLRQVVDNLLAQRPRRTRRPDAPARVRVGRANGTRRARGRRHRARAWTPRSSSASSSASTAPTRRARARAAASGSASRSSPRSPRRTAARVVGGVRAGRRRDLPRHAAAGHVGTRRGENAAPRCRSRGLSQPDVFAQIAYVSACQVVKRSLLLTRMYQLTPSWLG